MSGAHRPAPAHVSLPASGHGGRSGGPSPGSPRRLLAPGNPEQDAIHFLPDDRVVVDGNCVTSRGPGTALEFALKLVELLYGKDKAREVGEPMVLPHTD